MVKIRLSRGGAKRRPYYRIVALDHHNRRDGRPLEFLGSYDPAHNPEKVEFDSEKIDAWLAKGAQLSPAVASLMKRAAKRAATGAV
jgi:small subunit ribosomal protein S16